MNHLRFAGSWPPFVGITLGLVLAAVAVVIYRRETRGHPARLAHLLPWLRAGAILLLTLMLTGPTLQHRKISGSMTRLLCWVDTSLSMGITDPDMELPRKLEIAEQLGWLPPGTIPKEANQAADTLSRAISSLNRANDKTSLQNELQRFSDASNKALSLLRKAGLPENTAARMERELCIPVRELTKQEIVGEGDIRPLKQAAGRFSETAARWQHEGIQLAEGAASRILSQDRNVAGAVQRLDTTPRNDRVTSLLLGGGKDSLLAQLSSKFEVQLLGFDGKDGQLLWSSNDGSSALPASLPDPKLQTTNLTSPLLSHLGDHNESNATSQSWLPWNRSGESDKKQPPRTAVVLFSDGQHNAGPSPTELAKLLGDRKIPVYTVGFGQTSPPGDLAISALEAPESIFFEDRVRGSLTIKEDTKVGYPLSIKITSGERVVWEQTLSTTGRHSRKVPFDFSVKDLMAEGSDVVRKQNAARDLTVSAIPIPFTVNILPFPGEREVRNNTARFQVRATNRKRKILILDGRPRWETRYLRNLFERDPQWEVNALLAGTDSEKTWPRGELQGTFPKDARTLQTYDLIVFGEVPRAFLKDEELQWITSFVGERGGGLYLIDGRRGQFRQFVESPLGPLFPVRFPSRDVASEHPGFAAAKLIPTPRASALAPFTLSTAPEKANFIWEQLPPPRWVARCIALPGTETLLEAVQANDSGPAMVTRLFGAGRVVYAAFDESWRWRLDVAGLYQERFFNQLIPWIAEPPFALQDPRVSLDVGPFLYSPGDVAEVRARIRDAQGMPITDSKVAGTLWKDGVQVSTLSLEGDDTHHGVFRARTAPLHPGHYEFAIDSRAAGPSAGRVRLGFEVEPRDTGELGELTLNEDLLARMSAESQGQYLREEKLSLLKETLAPLEEGQAIETETILWQSYVWFLLVMALLTTEWTLRKRIGLV